MRAEDGVHPYVGATFALLTQHGKERCFTPALEAAFSARVQLVSGCDTDALGTFTREVPRAGTQRDAAVKKARVGMELSRVPLGLASEGSFGPGPLGLGAWDVELAVLVDAARGVEIIGRAEGPGLHVHAVVESREGLEDFLRRADFPRHGVVLRPDGEDDPRVEKGLASRAALEESFARCLGWSKTGRVFAESDLRAHVHPTRMMLIELAVHDLVRRMESECAKCGVPGFGLVGHLPGLPCRECGAQTRLARAERLGCVRCDHRVERPLRAFAADPASCDVCNP